MGRELYDCWKKIVIKNSDCIIRRSGDNQEKSEVRKKVIKCFYDSYIGDEMSHFAFL